MATVKRGRERKHVCKRLTRCLFLFISVHIVILVQYGQKGNSFALDAKQAIQTHKRLPFLSISKISKIPTMCIYYHVILSLLLRQYVDLLSQEASILCVDLLLYLGAWMAKWLRALNSDGRLSMIDAGYQSHHYLYMLLDMTMSFTGVFAINFQIFLCP